LRGAADANHDGRIGFYEAVNYATARTMEWSGKFSRKVYQDDSFVQTPELLCNLAGDFNLLTLRRAVFFEQLRQAFRKIWRRLRKRLTPRRVVVSLAGALLVLTAVWLFTAEPRVVKLESLRRSTEGDSVLLTARVEHDSPFLPGLWLWLTGHLGWRSSHKLRVGTFACPITRRLFEKDVRVPAADLPKTDVAVMKRSIVFRHVPIGGIDGKQ